MVTSYHVHTVFSDGDNTVGEMVKAAVDAGIDEVGISDHYVLFADGRLVNWSMPLDALPDYLDTIKEARSAFEGKINVRYGLEADFIPDAADMLRETLSQYSFDYVIGSIHFINGFPIDEHKKNWDALSEPKKNDVIRDYWNKIAQLAKSGLFDIVGHMDLYKKFGAQPTVDISEDIITALDAIAEAGIAVELNTSGWHKPIREAYPSAMIVKGCLKRGISIIVTADAHKTADIARDFNRGNLLLKGMGYQKQALFKDRKMTMIDL